MNQTRIQMLENLINYHNQKYWEENTQEISDIEYDHLVNELQAIDPENELFGKIFSPKKNIKREKITHKIPMLSLNKVYNKEDLIKWCKSVCRDENEIFLIQPKLDGISGNFTDNILSTRGNGHVGENISSKIPLIKYFSKNHAYFKLSELNESVRGELIITAETFEHVKETLTKSDGEEYKTARGLCSGLLMKDETDVIKENIIHFVNFNTITTECNLKSIIDINIEDSQKQLSEISYATDGFVVKLKDEEYSKSLGFTSHHPKGQIAYKFNNPCKETILLGIEWSVGKHTITPVGLVEPVNINNSTISRVSLHNGKFIIDNKIRIGDYLTIEKAGEIIPHVQSVRPGKDTKEINLDKCPRCGESITYNDPEIVCDNPNCVGKNVRNLYDSIIRLGIENLGPSTVQKLVDIGIESILDIFVLTKEDLEELPGFKEKSIDNLYNEIQKVKDRSIEDWRILSSLNLKGIGSSMSKKLLLDNSLSELKQMTCEDLIEIANIGDERANELFTGLFINQPHMEMLETFFPSIISSKNQQIKGKVCFTGKGDKPREYYKRMADRDGFIVCSNVTKDLSFLVTDNLNSNSSKMKKAKQNNIQIITYNQLNE